MSDVIEFLERMGREAGLRRASQLELADALDDGQIDPRTRKAILAADRRRLEFLAGATPNLCCMVYAPKGDEQQEEQERKAKDDAEEEARAA